MTGDINVNKHTHLCHGYDAALGDLVLKIEHYTRLHNTTFAEVIGRIHNCEFTDRFMHITKKYEHGADEMIERMYDLHNSWED